MTANWCRSHSALFSLNREPFKTQTVLFSPRTNWKIKVLYQISLVTIFKSFIYRSYFTKILTSKSKEVKIDQLLDTDSLNISNSSVWSTNASLSIFLKWRSAYDDAQKIFFCWICWNFPATGEPILINLCSFVTALLCNRHVKLRFLLPGTTEQRLPVYIEQNQVSHTSTNTSKAVILYNDKRRSIFFLLFSDTCKVYSFPDSISRPLN